MREVSESRVDCDSMRASLSKWSNAMKSSTLPLFKERLNVLYDGKCALCVAEINFLEKRDILQNSSRRLIFTDIESSDYNPHVPMNANVSYEAGMTKIHAVRSNGELLSGVQVFAAAYDEVGLGWMFRFLQWPAAATLASRVYDFWAAKRTDLTRQKSLEQLFVEREEARAAAALECDSESGSGAARCARKLS